MLTNKACGLLIGCLVTTNDDEARQWLCGSLLSKLSRRNVSKPERASCTAAALLMASRKAGYHQDASMHLVTCSGSWDREL